MPLSDEDKRFLCALARDALKAALTGGDYVPPPPPGPRLLEKRGCFVTLRTRGRLRGCVGCFVSDNPLYLTVAEYTRHSALDDPRFVGNRLKAGDLDAVALDISALTPLEPCRDPENIRLGVDGIHVRSGWRSGCLLPQVATEMNWTVEEFWGCCCREKAGLEWDAWRNPGVELHTFTAEVFDCGP